jgi:hypothetical protein
MKKCPETRPENETWKQDEAAMIPKISQMAIQTRLFSQFTPVI